LLQEQVKIAEKNVRKALSLVIMKPGTRQEWVEWAEGYLGKHYVLQDITDVFHSSRKPAEVLMCYAVTQLEAAKEGCRILQHKNLSDREEIEAYVRTNIEAASGFADEILRGDV
jgi:hypothetical protein